MPLATASAILWIICWANTSGVPAEGREVGAAARHPPPLRRLDQNANSAALPGYHRSTYVTFCLQKTPSFGPHLLSASHKFNRHIIAGCCSRFKTNRIADNKGHCFGFGFPDGLGGECSAFALVQHLMGKLMHKR